jgi:HEAT repeat protein
MKCKRENKTMKTGISGLLFYGLIISVLTLSGCSKNNEDLQNDFHDKEYIDTLHTELNSPDWSVRNEAVKAAKAMGWRARDMMLAALGDRSELINRTAQAWFIDHGEQALDYLLEKLLAAEEDSGMYASIVGGEERNRCKSIAGSIWLILVRGLPRERCYDIMQTLVRHPSAKVRAIVLHTAASLRNERFLAFFDTLSKDGDPLIREKYLTSLVRLLVLGWYSTPELDEPAVSRGLSLLEPVLPAIMNGDIQADFFALGSATLTLGDVLGRHVLPFQRKRFISLLETAIPRLNEKGAMRAGVAIERQCWNLIDRDKYPNSAWVETYGKRVRERDLLQEAFDRLIHRLETQTEADARKNYMAALSQFPYELFNDRLAKLFFHEELTQYESSSSMAVRFLLKSLEENDMDLRERALAVLEKHVSGRDDAKCLAAFKAGRYGLLSAGDLNIDSLKSLLKSHSDRLFAFRDSLELKHFPMLLDLLIRLGDGRCFQVFEEAWEHRSDDLDSGLILSECAGILAREREKRLLPYLIEHLNAGPDIIHTGLKVTCIYRILSPFYEQLLLDSAFGIRLDAVIERWQAVIQDPEEHPRVRASFAELLRSRVLTEAQRNQLKEVYLKLIREPQDWNIRSKACWNMAKVGERRIIPVLYNMMLSNDAPTWVYLNCLSAVYLLESRLYEDKDIGKKKAALKAVELLETLIALNPKPDPAAKIIQVNNYYSWSVQYHVSPPLMVLLSLRQYTGQDFGYDIDAWKKWCGGST